MSYQSTCEDLLCYAAGPTLGSNGGILDTSLVCEARQLGGNVALWQATKKRLCGEPWPTFSFMKKGRNVHGAEPGEPRLGLTELRGRWRGAERHFLLEGRQARLLLSYVCICVYGWFQDH